MAKLEGKVALVTGSGRNIRRATVLKLAAEGASVIVNSRSNHQEADAVANEARALGVKALPLIADVAKKAEVDRMIARAMSEFGRVDILINNAAIRPHKAFTEPTLRQRGAPRQHRHHAGQPRSGTRAGPRTPPASRSAVRARRRRSPPRACSWSPTTAASSPARPSTPTEASPHTELGRGLRLRVPSAHGGDTGDDE